MSCVNKVRSVVCICGGIGFPFGTASSKRIQLLGRGLVDSGLPFRVLHVGPSFSPDNKQPKGSYRGVSYEYLSPVVEFPRSKFFRVFCYLWGCLLLVWKLLRLPKGTLVYIYYQGSLLNLWTILLCRLLRKPMLQEACEWWPETPERTGLNAWMYHKVMFRWTRAALPISGHIEKLIKQNSPVNYPMHRVPVLVDPLEVHEQADTSVVKANGCVRLLWCGSLYAYMQDVKFMIQACANLQETHDGERLELVLCGPTTAQSEAEVLQFAKELGMNVSSVVITGFLSESELWGYCLSSDLFLMPLWDDRRSETRFPTKMGLYLAAGKPIITAAVGEVPYYLEDGQTGMFYNAGDVGSLVEQIRLALDDAALARQVAEKATEEVLSRVDYRPVCNGLQQWLQQEVSYK